MSAEQITWGDVTNTKHVLLWGSRVPVTPHEQGLPRIGTGSEIERAAQQGLTKLKLASFEGGLSHRTGIQPWGSALTEYVMNQGIQTRVPGLAALPYRLITQASLTGDISSAVASNLRVHAFNTALGASGLRFGFALGNRVYLDTSTTNPALAELSSTAFTDLCTAIEEQMVANNVRYAAFAYNGQTQDIRGFSSVSGLAYNSGWTTLVNLSNDDWVNAMRYMQTLGPGCAVYVGRLAGSDGVFYTLGTDSLPMSLKPCVLAASKDAEGSIPTVTTGAINFTAAGTDGFPSAAEGGLEGRWNGVSGILAQGGGEADAEAIPSELSTTTGVTGYILASAPNAASIADIPQNAFIKGVVFRVRARRENSNPSTGVFETAALLLGGSQGINHGATISLSTSYTNHDFGGTADTHGFSLRGADLPRLGAIARFAWSDTGPDYRFVVDHIALTSITYRVPGTTLAFPTGGWQIAPSPAYPHRIAMVAPESNDTTGILVPRKLWFLDFEWDVDGNRPVFTPSAPETNMRYIHHGCPFQGGYAVTGGDVAGPGRFVRHVDGSGQLRNFRVPRWNGKEWLCNSLHARGSWLIGDMVAADNSDRQWWLFNNGRWYPDTLWQSLSDTPIAAQPIPFAESALGLQQQQIYSVFPASTSTAAVRQFLPEDLDADPRLFNTSEVKSMAYTANTTEDSPLLLRGHEMDFGPEEANKALIEAEFQGRTISDDETVRVRVDITGDASFALPAFGHTFEDAFERHPVPDYGLAYRTFAYELGLMHEAGTAKTPNGTGTLFTTTQQWPTLHTIAIEIDEEAIGPTGVLKLLRDITTLQAERLTQPLTIGDKTYNAVYEGPTYALKTPPRGQTAPNSHVMALVLKFREVSGGD